MDKHFVQLFWEIPIIFIALLLLTRIQGKKAISHLTYFDYIAGIILGDIASACLINQDTTLTISLTALAFFGGLSILASIIGMKVRRFRLLAEGEPISIIKQGKILEENAKKVELDIDNLRMLLRKKDVFNVADVEFAVLETDGSLSVLKKSAKETITRADLKLNNKEEKPGIELIIDGVIDEQKIKEANLTKKDIENMLRQRKIKSVSEVSYMEITGEGKVYIDKYEDKLT
ncbi:YetF domain-containing protein [Shimazuella kribbensis]|uniref:YetF domain-containing protein n=1 Tax=Shimazuella kribbensis TaxID=139808 RepID=UPI00041FF025|nr:DUF421 domain-containing protein [Shimazuella kribbensis]